MRAQQRSFEPSPKSRAISVVDEGGLDARSVESSQLIARPAELALQQRSFVGQVGARLHGIVIAENEGEPRFAEGSLGVFVEARDGACVDVRGRADLDDNAVIRAPGEHVRVIDNVCSMADARSPEQFDCLTRCRSRAGFCRVARNAEPGCASD